MKNQKFIIVLIVCIIACGVFFAINLLGEKDEDKNLKNYPQEIQDVYAITKFVSISGMQEGKKYDFQVLDDKNRFMMLFNYLEYKGWLQEEISFDTMNTALQSLYGTTFDYGNFIFTYGKYVYQNDGNRIIGSALTNETTYEYSTKIESYSIKGNQITLDMKITGSVEDAIYHYEFEKSNGDYRLIHISLKAAK